jgi:hypothetical protein
MILPSFAFAKPAFQNLLWKADKTVEITFQTDAGPKVAKGFLDDNGSTSAVVGSLAVSAHSFTNSFIVVEYADIGVGEKYLLVLERQNANYNAVASEITGPAETIYSDFQAAIELLMKSKKWNVAQAIRAFVDFVNSGANHKVADFRSSVEAEQVALAKPISRRENIRKKALPAEVPKTEATALRYSPAKSRAPRPTVSNDQPQAPKRKQARREPLPYEPRYERSASDYPGQRMQRRRRYQWFNENLYR